MPTPTSSTQKFITYDIATKSAIMFVTMLVSLAMITTATAAASSVTAKTTYEYKRGVDVSSGYFIRKNTVKKDVYKEKIGVTCDATASTAPYFVISYQYFYNNVPYGDAQHATIYDAKRVNRVCVITKNGILTVRKNAVAQKKQTFKFLFNIAKNKHILPFD